MLKAVSKLVVALNSNVKKTEIAAGIAWGVLLGLVPAGNFFWVVLFLVSFFFNVHHGIKLGFFALVKVIAPAFAMAIDSLGWTILHIEQLKPLFTSMYNMPFVPFTKFNNTLVAGGLAAGVILWLPVFFGMLPLITLYRNTVGPKIRKSAVVQKIAKFPLFKLVDKVITGSGK